ncbi:MAG: hypothetical protein RAO94_05490 [Candidatus Stygibacter australis]|nr:hypothetical protein [Candidatus Stygibacter australis]MDP8321782.1 hypothetical protein [Candidatus Stygibacter australis]
MREKSERAKFKGDYLYSAVLFLVLGIILLPNFLYSINPDGFSYFSIAEKYLAGDFANAVNGYWGPLFSWLLLPFLAVGISAPMAAKVLGLLVGLIFIWLADLYYMKLNMNRKIKKYLLLVTSICTLYFAYNGVTSDFLFAFFLLLYLNIMLNLRENKKLIYAIFSGLVGGLLYLTKAYGLPFFIVHYFVSIILFIMTGTDRSEKRKLAWCYMAGMLVFLLLTVPWILTISAKYGHVTIGSSGKFNHAIVGPETEDFPMHLRGLLPPPYNSATSVWEDISYTKMVDWSATSSVENFLYQVLRVVKNIAWILIILSQYSFLSIFILLGLILYLYKKGRAFVLSRKFYLLLSMLILFSGYALILVVIRYLWVCAILLLGISASLLHYLFKEYKISKAVQIILMVVFLISFMIYPAHKLMSSSRGESHLVRLNRYLQEFQVTGRVASNSKWHDCVWLAYFNDWQYYGEQGVVSDQEYLEQLKRYNIDYYIHWKGEDELPFTEGAYKEITSDKYSEFRIYALGRE